MSQLNYKELSSILAGLRILQDMLNDKALPSYRKLPHFDDVDPLSSEEIDLLCERLNVGSDEPDGEVVQIAFDIVSGSAHQLVRITNAEYDEDALVEGLKTGKLATSTWFDQEGEQTIDVVATGEAVAVIVSQEINGEYEDFR